jgi:hypothetical protein
MDTEGQGGYIGDDGLNTGFFLPSAERWVMELVESTRADMA